MTPKLASRSASLLGFFLLTSAFGPCTPTVVVDKCAPGADGGCVSSPAPTDLGTVASADAATAHDLAPSASDLAVVAGGLESAGSGDYIVESVTQNGVAQSMFCVDVPAWASGSVGDTLTFDFTSSGVSVNTAGHPSDGTTFPAATSTQGNFGGSVDTTMGSYVSSDEYDFTDDQSPDGTSPSTFYYSMSFARSGSSLVLTYKIPNPAGGIVCTLTKKTP